MKKKLLISFITAMFLIVGALYAFSSRNMNDIMASLGQKLQAEQGKSNDGIVAVVNEKEITQQQLNEYRILQNYSYDLALAAYENAKHTDDYTLSPETYDTVYAKTIDSLESRTIRDLIDDLMKSALLNQKVSEAGIELDIAKAARDFAPTKEALYADKEFGDMFTAYAQSLGMTLEEYISDLAIPNLARVNAHAQYAESHGIKAEELSQFKNQLLDDARVEYRMSAAELDQKVIS